MSLVEQPVILVGAGMHGRVVRDLCRDAGIEVAGFLDDFTPAGTRVDDVEVLGPLRCLQDAGLLQSRRFIVTIGNNIARQTIADRIESSGGSLAVVTHPNCVVSPTATIGFGTVLVGATMVFSRAQIGKNVLVDPDTTVGAEATIADGAYIAPGVHLGSRVRVGQQAFLGLGAVVLPDIVIGRLSIVGAGAVVNRNVADETLVVGNPGEPKGKAVMDTVSPYPARRRNA
jgi:sugar O-acyltransferase (sialic acid O-acetyltransferase NeuD family)